MKRSVVVQCIEDEPELPGPMPDSIWHLLQNRNQAEEVLRGIARVTKAGILSRLPQEDAEETNNGVRSTKFVV